MTDEPLECFVWCIQVMKACIKYRNETRRKRPTSWHEEETDLRWSTATPTRIEEIRRASFFVFSLSFSPPITLCSPSPLFYLSSPGPIVSREKMPIGLHDFKRDPKVSRAMLCPRYILWILFLKKMSNN